MWRGVGSRAKKSYRGEEETMLKKHKIIYGKYITFGIYKKNFFGSNQWLFNITDFEEGLKELLHVLSINKIKYLAIEATDLNKTNEELLKIIREIFKNVTIKIKIKN